MAQDYNTWLAANVLNEQQYISYRNVSRALKVHSNIAKQMLYEFHRKQNTKKPGSIHATYLLTGTKRQVQTNGLDSRQDGEDTVMRSSPPLPSSSMPHGDDDEEEEVIAVRSIMLVKEEHLDQAKAIFDTITGVHIYSLQASALNDFQGLAECNRKLATEYASEDPLKEWKQYGVIQNSNVKRRTGKRPPPPAPPAAKPEAVKAKAAASAASKTSAAEAQAATKPAPKSAAPEPSKTTASKPPTNKRQDSNLFKSFAKGAAKPKKKDSQGSSAAPSPAPAAQAEDVDMTGFSDDDDIDADGGLPEELNEVKAPAGKSKKDRKAELDAMMDMEDEPMEDAATPAAEEEEKHDEGAVDKAQSEADEPKETVVVENGRRRGRRRVMKKKTVKDEDGYLVTREEAAWESFSEEEPAPKKPKVSAPVSNKPAAKKGAKPGQGNIMSFFSKK